MNAQSYRDTERIASKNSQRVLIAIVVMFYLPVTVSAVDEEVDVSYCGRYVDRVLFGANHAESFEHHNGELVGDTQPESCVLSRDVHYISWDFAAQQDGLHVLMINCSIFSEARVATPYYYRDGSWIELPQLVFREPWNEHRHRHYLIYISEGVTRFKVQFSGQQWNMFYIAGAGLYEKATADLDTYAPLIIDYIDTQPTDRSCTISWLSNEDASVRINYGQTPDVDEGAVSDDNLTLEHSLTCNDLSPLTHYYFTVTQTDELENTATYGPYEFDTYEFLFPITNTHYNAQTENSVTMLWQTGLPSTTIVKYGTTPDLGGEISDPAYLTDHMIKVDGLTPDTVYYFMVESYDIDDNPSRDDNDGTLYRFKTCAAGQEPYVIEISGDGIDNDCDGYMDGEDPEGQIGVDTRLGDPYGASYVVGSLIDKVDFGYRHWSMQDGDPISDDDDIDDSFGEHNGTYVGGDPRELCFYGGASEWDFTVPEPGYYICVFLSWWKSNSAVGFYVDDAIHYLPQPSGDLCQIYLTYLPDTLVRFRFEGGYQFHCQVYKVKSDPFSNADLDVVHPKQYFSPDVIQALNDKIERVHVLSQDEDNYKYYLLNGWGSATDYLGRDFSAMRKLGDARDYSNGLSYLSLAYILTGDGRYSDKLIEMLLIACSWETGWGRDRSVLKNGEMLAGMAMGYDMVYEQMTPYQRDIVRRAIDRECQHLWVKSINAEHYGDGDYWWASEHSNNWQTVSHGGLGAAALSILGESKYADEYINQAIRQCKMFMETNFDADGVFQETFMYYGYAMNYLCLFLDPLKRTKGIDLFHYNDDVIGKSAYWYMCGIEPTKIRFNAFDDCRGYGLGVEPYLLKIASEYQDEYVMWFWDSMAGVNRNREINGFLNSGGTTFTVPMCMIWYDDTVPLTSPKENFPLGNVWPDWGRAVCQTGFESYDDIKFYMQCGTGGGHGRDADQGSFYLNAYGERLVDEGGIYGYDDSVYHNIILIDGVGQGQPSIFFENIAGIPGFLNTDFLDYIEADSTVAYGYEGVNPVEKAIRHVVFVRPMDSRDAYFVMLDEVDKNDGQAHKYEFLLHAKGGQTIEHLGDGDFRFNGAEANLEIKFALPQRISYLEEVQSENNGEVHFIRVCPSTDQIEGKFLTLLYPTDGTHLLPPVNKINSADISGFEIGHDTIIHNKTTRTVTYGNMQTDAKLFTMREGASLDYAGVFKATTFGYGAIEYIRADKLVAFVFAVMDNGYRFVIGSESILEPDTVELTLGGLQPDLTYERIDNGEIRESFQPLADGTHTYTQPLGKHIVLITEEVVLNTLDISSGPGGSVSTPGEGSFEYEQGNDVLVKAEAQANYHFVNWTGTAVDAGKAADPSSASTTVAVDADYTLQANFAIDQHSLTVSSTSGGSVTSPGEGPFEYDHGSSVSIQVSAETNYHFVNWTGTAVDAGNVAEPTSPSTTVTVDSNYTLRANFAIDQRTLTVSSTSGGSISAPGEGTHQYDHGTDVRITATADTNYHFANWTGTAVDAGKVTDPVSASTRVQMDADYTLQANFAIDKRTLDISSTSGGSVATPSEGSFDYDHGSAVPIRATAEPNYHFVNWTGSAVDAGKVSNPDEATTTVTVDADYTLRANFAIDQRTLTTSSTDGGSVTSPGEGSYLYDLGSEVIVTATASANYHFVQWSGDISSTQNPIAVTMDADYAIQAGFALDQRTLTVSSTSGGSVSEPGEGAFLYDHGTVASIVCSSASGHSFVNWTGTAADMGKVADASSASTSVTIDGDYTLQANFAIIRRVLAISSTTGGSVTAPGEGNLQYDHGTVVSLIASPATGHAFVNWTGTAVDADQVADASSASTSVRVDGDYTLRANFAVEQRTLTTSSTDGGVVTTPGEGAFQYDYGTAVPVVASAASGYAFVNWTGTAVDAGKVANTALASTSVTVDGDYTLQANFILIRRVLTISSTAGGSVTTPGEGNLQYDHGEVVSVVASPDVGYAFVNWTGTAADAGEVVDTGSASTSVTVHGDYTLQANFAVIGRALTISSTTGGSVMTPGEGNLQYNHGEVVSVVASPDVGYAFVNWTGTAVDAGKVADATSPTTDVTVDDSYTLRANFALKVDLNRDGQLDLRDVQVFSQAWLSVPPDHELNVVCDLNSDEHIDWLDWAIFASAWSVEED